MTLPQNNQVKELRVSPEMMRSCCACMSCLCGTRYVGTGMIAA